MKNRKEKIVLKIFICLMALCVFHSTVYDAMAKQRVADIKLFYMNQADTDVPTTQASQDTTKSEDDKKQETGWETVTLSIDNQNKYDGMSRTYADGYVPTVAENRVTIVFPIISEGALRGDLIQTKLVLGDAQTAPFVFKNYEKTIRMQTVKVNDGAGKVRAYPASFTIDLKEKRTNGSYPVILSVKGKDTYGNEISQEFTTYVTITDGINPDAEPTTEAVEEPLPTFAPKMMVESYSFSKTEIYPGDTVTAHIVLRNTSKENNVKNMTVSISAENENFTLLSKSDSVYVDSIKAQDTYTVSFEYRIGAAVASGQYDLELSMDYADGDGNTYTASGKAKLDIVQEAKMQFDPLVIEKEVTVADVVEAKVQAMNLGRSKVYNVRAELSADGLIPEGTIFVGDMEAGTAASNTTQVSVSSLSGDNLYGQTQGVVTYYYEDECGQEFKESAEFSVTIQSPFSEKQQVEEDDANQWWMVMAVIGILVVAFLIVFTIRKIRRKTEE